MQLTYVKTKLPGKAATLQTRSQKVFVLISEGMPVTVTDNSSSFPQSIHAGTESRLDHLHFIPDPFLFIVH
jgi:hypothetical protein